jgi:sulfite exporter TauE/SafE
MVFVGLQFLGLLRHRRLQGIGSGADVLVQALRRLVAAPGPAAPLALGVLNGFLPCPLVYAFVAQAATCGGALSGLQLMATFGLGTFPAMLAMGGLGWWRRSRAAGLQAATVSFMPLRPSHALNIRVQGVRLAGGFIVLLGLVTLARGVLPAAAHLHGL